MTSHSLTSNKRFARNAVARWLTVLGIAILILTPTNLRVEAKPPPAQRYSLTMTLSEVGSDHWQSEPIKLDVTIVGLSWDGQAPDAGWVRASADGTVWGEWVPLAIDAEHGPDSTSGEYAAQRSSSEPLYLNAVEWVQYRIRIADPGRVRAEMVETEGRHLGLAERVHLWFESLEWAAEPAAAIPDQPDIVPREAWGGDSCNPNTNSPSYTPAVRMMFVHHTTNYNEYLPEDVLGIIYAMCTYHVETRGWNDIGYNFVIDRFGTIYEARDGGIENAVWGAHTGGFNYYSTGVGLIGDLDVDGPSTAALDSLEELAAWKLDLHHVDPTDTIDVISLGSTKYAAGVTVNLRTISGHRDGSATACPGDVCYDLIDSVRTAVYPIGGAKIFGGVPSELPLVLFEDVSIPFSFSEPMDWVFRLVTSSGDTIVQTTGSGSSGTGTWDGMIDGQTASRGNYTIEIDAVTQDDGETPTPVRAVLQWYEPPFSDDDFNVHQDNIALIAAAGITFGCSSVWDWYCPSDEVRRDQMASFIARALDLPPASQNYFSDDNGSPHEAAINSMAEAGITFGCGNGLYCPRETVRRDHMAVFLARALGLGAVAEDYFDDDDGLYETEINAIASVGITFGCGNGNYCPAAIVERDQMASFLARVFVDSDS
jgi:hypothetical protein